MTAGSLVLELPRERLAPRGPWVWNLGLPSWVPVVCRVAWLRQGAEVPGGSWVWVLGRLYVSDRRWWGA